MPPGAKKRKAAKRKKEEEELGIHHHPSPNSPTGSTPQGSSGLESESSAESGGGGGGRGEEAVMAEERGEDAGEYYEVKDVGIEYVVTKNDSNGSSTTHLEAEHPPPPPPAAAAVDSEVTISEVVELEQMTAEGSAAPLAEEEVEISEAAASVAAADIPPVSTVCEEQQLPDVVERSEIAATAEVVSPAAAPLLEHRATLWNCCGLLDAFKGNQR